MTATGDYGSLNNDTSTSGDMTSCPWKVRRRTLSQIPEERSMTFEASLATSVFSGRGLGAGAGSLEQQKLSSYTRRQLIFLACVAYGNFWVAACVSLQAPFFPQEAERKGASSTIYGLVFGVYELMIITMSPIFGRMVAKMSPNVLVQVGLLVCGISTIIFGILDRVPDGMPFISMAFVVRILEGIGAASFLTASYTIMAGEFPDRVATIFALLETCFGLGLILGPTVGGALYGAAGYMLPFVVLGTFLLFGGVIAFCALPKSVDRVNKNSSSLWHFLADGNTLLDAAATATSLNFIGFNAATFEPHLRQFHLIPIVTGSLFVLTGAVYAVTSPLMGKLCESEWISEKTICLFGCVLVLSGSIFIGPLPFIAFEPQLWVIVVSLLLIGLGLSAKLVSSFVDAINHNIRVRHYPDDMSTYGMVSALFFSSCSVGAFIGPSAGGYLLEHFGYRSASLYIFATEALMIMMFVIARIRRNSSQEESKGCLFSSSKTRSRRSCSQIHCVI